VEAVWLSSWVTAAALEARSLENFDRFVQEDTEPGGNAGIPGTQLPMGLSARSCRPSRWSWTAGSDWPRTAIGVAVKRVLGRCRQYVRHDVVRLRLR